MGPLTMAPSAHAPRPTHGCRTASDYAEGRLLKNGQLDLESSTAFRSRRCGRDSHDVVAGPCRPKCHVPRRVIWYMSLCSPLQRRLVRGCHARISFPCPAKQRPSGLAARSWCAPHAGRVRGAPTVCLPCLCQLFGGPALVIDNGSHPNIPSVGSVVPPSWIVEIPPAAKFKPSLNSFETVRRP